MDVEREHPCPPPSLPSGIAADVAGYAWARDTVGESGGTVHRLHGKTGAPDLFLKYGRGTVANDVTDEMVRLGWLADHSQVPRVRTFLRTPNEAWLLMTAIPGRTAYQMLVAHPDDRPAVVAALSLYLRQLHAIPTAACPFNADHGFRLSQAKARIDAGVVDTDDFDEERTGWTADRVWDAMQALLPMAPDPVVTHGDFSLDNILIEDGAVVGCIDVGRTGIADRYQDLAILWNCLGEFGPALQDRLFSSYGISEPDKRKLDFHLLLDELF
ncbi:APH(3')-I family aminoglycoside O-phosphotransferase [Sphingomonas prati]|uniref:Aminoglycoside 3'-phosphotransferase n=1 Tax=Sphingomonas prati TaxID=1843237 RepID=A0A7W9BTE4_9SPHN|nr:APH(3')-I family aminoglycoside O-phosphotransferase [Sphingomonas prati]MBB5729787.1 aminoglycoside 3'-phosphotransferase-1 [Sphingomonas prati]GGE89532.1 aminoglycoside 3'-phosphotransferase [Sphingomonas prati]